jgi:ATP-dependent RNA helicase SUPV3L1/SUV3
MRALGYRLHIVAGAAHYAWRGQRRPAAPATPIEAALDAGTMAASPFAILAAMKGR